MDRFVQVTQQVSVTNNRLICSVELKTCKLAELSKRDTCAPYNMVGYLRKVSAAVLIHKEMPGVTSGGKRRNLRTCGLPGLRGEAGIATVA